MRVADGAVLEGNSRHTGSLVSGLCTCIFTIQIGTYTILNSRVLKYLYAFTLGASRCPASLVFHHASPTPSRGNRSVHDVPHAHRRVCRRRHRLLTIWRPAHRPHFAKRGHGAMLRHRPRPHARRRHIHGASAWKAGDARPPQRPCRGCCASKGKNSCRAGSEGQTSGKWAVGANVP